MNVIATLHTHESDDPLERVEVRSHWNQNGMRGLVVLVVGGKEFVVSSRELRRAIDSCTGLK